MATRTKRTNAVLTLVVLLSLLLSACGSPTPEATPSAGPPTATLPPTATPPPTVTPMPLPAPQLLLHSPAPGEEQPLDAPIELTFDQPMNRDSVEAAFEIQPAVEGEFTWLDDRTLAFDPLAELERGASYVIAVDAKAENVEGKGLEEPASFTFSTVGFLEVSQVMPSADSNELDPDTVVTVVFNRPVVPLAAISQQGELPQPLTLVPPVQGRGEWLNTSIYLFMPTDGLLPGTHYKARVAAGLTDTTGAALEEDYTWEFETIQPAILQVSPPEDFALVGPTDVISVTFNQPMDHTSAQSHFSLEMDGQPVAGSFRWAGGQTPTEPETMFFVPEEPLLRDTAYSVRVAAGVQGQAGNTGTEKQKSWIFSTVRQPGIESTSPRNGARGVEPGGGVAITFASPMQRKGFLDHVTIRPAVTEVYTYWLENDTQVEIQFQSEPVTAYEVSLDSGTPDKYGASLGEVARIRFTTGDLPAIASLTTVDRLGTVSAYTETVVYATYRNVSTLQMALYRLSPSAFMDLNTEWDAWDQFVPDERELVRSWSQKVQAPRNEARLERLLLVDTSGQALPPGLYYLQLIAPGIQELEPSRYMFVKSRLNLTLKQTRTEALVWATDLASGQPVSDLSLALYSGPDKMEAVTVTDAEGLAIVRDLSTNDLWSPFFAVVGELGGDDFGIAYNRWEEGINPWDFGIESEFWGSDYQGYLYTDRPIYRPGQTVYFKGIVRADDDAVYSVPGEIESVHVYVNDAQGNELYRQELPLSDMGTFYDELALDEQAPLGDYYVDIQEPDLEFYAGTSFRVAEYEAPDFQVSVTPARDAYLAGETIAVTAEATYYFGGPVADADVHWSVLSDDYYFRYDCPQGQSCPWYSWTDSEWGEQPEGDYYYGYGRLVAEGDARTDSEGRVTFNVPANLGKAVQSQLFTIEASVTDINAQQVSNRTATIVHRGEFYIGVAPRGNLTEVGEEKPIDLLTVDWNGEPVAEVELVVTLMEHRWYSVRRQAEDGRYYWDWTVEDIPVETSTVTTDDQGRAVATFVPPKAGTYRVRAAGVDGHENEIRSSDYFWAWGGQEYVSWRQESNNRIDLIADKEEYEIGDVAEILIPSPYTGTVQALVTVERGHIMETEVRELSTNSEVLRVPIVEAHVPNVFVSILIVEGSDQATDGLATFKMGVVKLPVSVGAKTLNISLTPDKPSAEGEHYGPRDTATYDLLVTDYEGNPVEAELSLRLADLAVLALADEPGPTLVESFWRDRGLGVKTSTPLIVAMEPFNREIAPDTKGGDGVAADMLVRSRFADTAFWDPAVRTDKEGRAQVTVELPDNLTTWRMQAQGITVDTKVGRTDVDVVSTLDLLVRPVLPRFFVVNDQAQIATVVHNNTREPLEVQVSIEVEGLALEGARTQTVEVGASGKVQVPWSVQAVPGSEATVRMRASAGNLSDAREDTLPIYHYTTPEVVSTAGVLSEPGVRQEVIQLPRAFDSTQGGLAVTLEGSLAAATQDALDYLEHYPYECVEQTVSRFLPNVVTWQALEEMGLERPELRQKLAQMVGIGLQRLYAQQHYDGGWGWWTYDESNPYLTAYVLHGMLEAYRAGFVVDQEAMDKAVGYLRETLPSVTQIKTASDANRLAYALYTIASYADTFGSSFRGELGRAVRLFDDRHLLDHYGRATLAMALALMEPDEPQRVNTLLDDLTGDAVLSATGAHWEEAEPDYWNMNTDVRSTAVALWALAKLRSNDQLLPATVRWLMAVREEGHWQTTQDSAWSLLGLVAYMQATGELAGDYGYRVYLNGQELAAGDISQDNIDQSQELQVEIARLLAEEGNRLVIERQAAQAGQTGEGQLYYSADMRTYLPADHVQALDRGIVVARQYSPADDAGQAGAGQYVDTARVGDVIQVKLTLIAPTDLYYVVVEDPLPAGFEGVDLSLKTTSVVGEQPTLRNLTAEEEDLWYRRYGWGWWWFSNSEMRDEKMVLFAEYLPRGTYEYTYLIRAGIPGDFYIMPTTAYEMYFPEVFGRSDGGKFTIQPSD
jgi:uncharacterized protein YfaS (alpha-2-macroglobulin family)